jgi:hypothetical protein
MIIDLRLGYYKRNLTITGKVPIPAVPANNRDSGVSPYYGCFEPIPFAIKARVAA